MPTRYLIGVILLLLGAGYLIDQFYGTDFVGRYWPALIILAGVNELLRRPSRPWWPLLLVVIGVVLLGQSIANLPLNPWAVIGAALLIGIGLRLLIPSRARQEVVRGHEANMTLSEDRIQQSVTFGGAKIHVVSRQFRGGRVSVTFGGADIDLREANLAPEGADLALEATFGGINVYVPEGWPVQVVGAPTLGGCETRLKNTEIAVPGGAALRITCSGAFSGVEIKN